MTSTSAMVIIGAGHVGGRAAQHLREAGWDGPILLIGAEPHAPYERPPLSKAVLTGEQEPASCALRDPAAWDADRIARICARVAALDVTRREVHLADGRRVGYAAALLATGGRARRLRLPGAEHARVLTLRTLDDAVALAARLVPGASLAIVGGGFIGLEVAASARQRGCEVHVIESAARLLGRAVPASIAASVQRLHTARGVAITLDVTPRAIEADEERLVVVLQDGRTVRADNVVVGIGIEPELELARACGLALGGSGIRVDATLATSADHVFAAGDVAEFPSPLSGKPIRQETWHNAETQARTAARNMLGAKQPYVDLAWVWSDQYDHQLQVVGEPALAASTVTRPLGANAMLDFHVGRDQRLVGASGFGVMGEVGRELKLARLLVERRAAVAPGDLADPAVKLKALLSSASVAR